MFYWSLCNKINAIETNYKVISKKVLYTEIFSEKAKLIFTSIKKKADRSL